MLSPSGFVSLGILYFLLCGCGGTSHESDSHAREKGDPGSHEEHPGEEGWEVEVSGEAESDHGHEGHDHIHEAPHGGTLIALGEHFAHLEVIHDATEGKVTLYVLNGEAEKAVQIEQEALVLRIDRIERPGSGETSEAWTPIHLKAVANPLTGETVGDTSEFSGAAPFLAGSLTGFAATLEKISLLGSDLENIEIRYPEGNEE